MRLHEFEAKQLFARCGIPTPMGALAFTAAEAESLVESLGTPVMIKAQVLAGGRGKAGGIQPAATPAEAGRHTARILDSKIHGLRPASVLIEERLEIVRELYLGIAIDGAAGCPMMVISGRGGVDIEALAHLHPGAIASRPIDPLHGLSPSQAHDLAAAAGLESEPAERFAEIAGRLCQLFTAEEALLAEINPLALLADGRLLAADAVFEIDDAALFRHPQWQPLERIVDPRARQARQQGMTYVALADGEIGLICSGAGLGMATVDLLVEQAQGGCGRPANFLETGGGITRELMASALRLVLSQPGIKAVLINVYGGINPIHEGAIGVAEVLAEGVSIPIVAKALGNHQEETWEILRRAGVEVVPSLDTEDAVAAVLLHLTGKCA